MARVQTIARLELHEEWHRRTAKTSAGRLAMLPYIHIGLHHVAAVVDVVAVDAGSMIAILPNHPESPSGRSVPFATRGNMGYSDFLAAFFENGFLLTQLHNNGSPAILKRGDVGGHHVAHGGATDEHSGTKAEEGETEERGMHAPGNTKQLS